MACAASLLRCCDQFWDADQVVGDQIEHEVGGDATEAAMFGLAHGNGTGYLPFGERDQLTHNAAKLNDAWWRWFESGQCNPPVLLCQFRR
jgi:hypothetical protein